MPYTNDTLIFPDYNATKKHYNACLPRAHPENWPEGPWRWTGPEPAALTPEQVFFRQQAQVRRDAEQAYREPITLPDGTTWNGGVQSAQALNGEIELSEWDGSDTATLYDINNDPHILPIADAREVAAAVGRDYRAKFAAKQAAMRALSAVDLTAPNAIDQINVVSFASYLPA